MCHRRLKKCSELATKQVNSVKRVHVEFNEVSSKESDNKKGWVNWGAKNLYPQYLNYLYANETDHGGIVNGKVNYITSGGLRYDGEDEQAWTSFFNNGPGETTLDDVGKAAAKDLELFNAFCIKGVWDVTSGTIKHLKVIPFEKIRFGVEGQSIYVKKDWTDSKEDPKQLRPLDLKRKVGAFYFMYYVPPKQMSNETGTKIENGVYPLPPYHSAIRPILTSIAVDKYQLNEILNGFSAGTLVVLMGGEPEDPKIADEIDERIKETAGADGAGGVMLVYGNPEANQPVQVLSLQGNNLNDRYANLERRVSERVIRAHSVTDPAIFGLSSQGSFNQSQMDVGYTIMQNGYFRPKQMIIASALTMLGKKCNGLKGDVQYNSVNLDGTIVKVDNQVNELAQKINSLPELQQSVVLSDLTPNERRQMVGLPPRADGNRLRMAEEPSVEQVIGLFAKRGRPRDEVRILYSAEMDHNDVDGSGQRMIDEFFKEQFEIENPMHVQVLSLINDGNSFDAIRRALDINGSDLAGIYNALRRGEYINQQSEVLQAGLIELVRNDTSKMSIEFTYEVRPGFGPEVISGTRDFCRELIGLNRIYSREDINAISGIVGRDVWTYRGGWYHNPDTGVNQPFCRHYWKQNVVFG